MRIGIVDDLAIARETLRRVVTSVPGHQVAWLASDGAEAVNRALVDKPDLILMDLIMPTLDGVQATRKIMANSPCPILLVTASVSRNMNKVYEAMGHGALDAVDTPCVGPRGDLTGAGDLLAKIATIGKLVGTKCSGHPTISPSTPRGVAVRSLHPLIAIGASTGGPNAIAEVIAEFPKSLKASVVIIQHVDVAFAGGLARWLSERTGHFVKVAAADARPEPGDVLLAATNDHLLLDRERRFQYRDEPAGMCYRPSVDVFFSSLVRNWPEPGVGVVLTGMGKDGAAGLLALRNAGWHTIAQDEATSVVWGMPRAAAEIGAAVEVLPVAMIGGTVVRHIKNQLIAKENLP